jgi:hypothetical protein
MTGIMTTFATSEHHKEAAAEGPGKGSKKFSRPEQGIFLPVTPRGGRRTNKRLTI